MTTHYYGVGRSSDGLLISVDGGYTWTNNTSVNLSTKIAVPATNPFKVVTFSAQIGTSTGILFRVSLNSGALFFNSTGTYTSLSGVDFNFDKSSIYAYSNELIFAALTDSDDNIHIFKSSDGGFNFGVLSTSFDVPPDDVVEILVRNPNLIYLVAKNGVYASTDLGVTFELIPNTVSTNITHAAINGRVYYIEGTVLYSYDNVSTVESYSLQDAASSVINIQSAKNDTSIFIRIGNRLYRFSNFDSQAVINNALINPITNNLWVNQFNNVQGSVAPFVFINEDKGVISFASGSASVATTEDGAESYVNNIFQIIEFDFDGAEICGCPENSVYDPDKQGCFTEVNGITVLYTDVHPCPAYKLTACDPNAPTGMVITDNVNFEPYVGQYVTINTNDPKYQGCYFVELIFTFSSTLVNVPDPNVQSFSSCEECNPQIFELSDCSTGDVLGYSDTFGLSEFLSTPKNDIIVSYIIIDKITGEEIKRCIKIVPPADYRGEPLTDLSDTIETFVIYEDCECCNAEPVEEEPKVEIRFFDNAYLVYTKSKFSNCDIDVNKKFAKTYYKKYLELSQGITHCCPGDLQKDLYNKILNDYQMKIQNCDNDQ